MSVSTGDKVIIDIEKIVYGGEGLGFIDDFAVFVPMTVPGDRVEIEIISKKKTYARGLITKLIKAGPERIEDTSKISFEDFHGCDFGMLNYESQLKYKTELVKDVMEKIGGIKDVPVSDIIGAEEKDTRNYRNKVIEPFALDKNRKIITGMFKRKSHEVFEVKENILSSELANKIINIVKKMLNKSKISVYREKEHKGLLRHIMVRTNSRNEAMLALVINSKKVPKDVEEFLKGIYENTEEIKSVYVSLNSDITNVALGKENIHLFGDKYIKESINGINFNISPNSFFQINVNQTKKLYDIGISFFDNIQDKYIVDAFSGTGTIGMILSKNAEKVYSIEIVKEAVKDGMRTAKENNIENIEFITGDVNKELLNLIEKGKRVDAVIFDPPRKGIEGDSLVKLAGHGIEEIVYISCNPSTFARDSKILTEQGYRLEKIQPVDMFPRTSHIEVVGKFRLNK